MNTTSGNGVALMGCVSALGVEVYIMVDALYPVAVEELSNGDRVVGGVFTVGRMEERMLVFYNTLVMDDLPTRTITPSRYVLMSATTHCATIIRFPLVTLMEMAPLLLLLSILYPSSLLATFARSLMLTVSTLQGSVYLHPLIGTG